MVSFRNYAIQALLVPVRCCLVSCLFLHMSCIMCGSAMSQWHNNIITWPPSTPPSSLSPRLSRGEISVVPLPGSRQTGPRPVSGPALRQPSIRDETRQRGSLSSVLDTLTVTLNVFAKTFYFLVVSPA